MKLKENSKTLLLEFISLARLSLNSVAAYLSQSQQILTGSQGKKRQNTCILYEEPHLIQLLTEGESYPVPPTNA